MLIYAQSVSANQIPMPNLSIGETAYAIERYQYKCGETVWYDFTEWFILTINGKWLLVGQKNSLKTWIDRNLDGRLDEFWDDDGSEKKYQNVCDILKK